jgi:hypothetical protein
MVYSVEERAFCSRLFLSYWEFTELLREKPRVSHDPCLSTGLEVLRSCPLMPILGSRLPGSAFEVFSATRQTGFAISAASQV